MATKKKAEEAPEVQEETVEAAPEVDTNVGTAELVPDRTGNTQLRDGVDPHKENVGFAVVPADKATEEGKALDAAKAMAPAPAELAGDEAVRRARMEFANVPDVVNVGVRRNPMASEDDGEVQVLLTAEQKLEEARIRSESDETEDALTAAYLRGNSEAERFRIQRKLRNIEQEQNDALSNIAERPENRDLEQEKAIVEAQPPEAFPDKERAREQITQQTDDPELLEAEAKRFRPRNDPQKEAGIDSGSVENPEIVLNQDKTR